ncbi:hypothetical protein GCM10027347_54230 [Larkinella harenae]
MMQSKPSIWLIDDDENVADIISRAFHKEQIECDITTFHDVSLVKSNLLSNQPTLMLVDYQMPEMDGIEFIRWLRSNLDQEAPKIILFSQMSADYIVSQTLQSGIDPDALGIYRIQRKPFDFQEWRHFAKEICEEGNLLSKSGYN